MTRIEVSTGGVSDAASRGRTDIADAVDPVKKTAAAAGKAEAGPLGAAFGKVAEHTQKAARQIGDALEHTNKTARDLGVNDSRGAARLRGNRVPNVPRGGSNGAGLASSFNGGAAGGRPTMMTGTPVMQQPFQQQMVPQQTVMQPAMATAGMQPGGVMLTPQQVAALQQVAASTTGADDSSRSSRGGGGVRGSGRLADLVRKVLGLPYAWGGGDLKGPTLGTQQDSNVKGFDCSSLARWLTYHDTGVQLPRTSEEQYAATSPRSGEPQPGDLVFPKGAGTPPGHVQIYIGNGEVVHAPQSNDVIKIAPLEQGARIHAAVPQRSAA